MSFARKTTASAIAPATFTTKRGHCRPFGATPGPDGVNFAVFSRHAQRVHLVLYRDDGSFLDNPDKVIQLALEYIQ